MRGFRSDGVFGHESWTSFLYNTTTTSKMPSTTSNRAFSEANIQNAILDVKKRHSRRSGKLQKQTTYLSQHFQSRPSGGYSPTISHRNEQILSFEEEKTLWRTLRADRVIFRHQDRQRWPNSKDGPSALVCAGISGCRQQVDDENETSC